jgi:O-antigen/teichoic acid export membrane protein
MTSNLLNLILGFLFWFISARYYTPEEVGTTSALLSSMLMIGMISGLGFNTAIVFYLPRDNLNANRMLNSCLTSSMVASIAFSLIFVLGIDIWAPSLKNLLYDLKFLLLFVAVTTMTTASGLISSAFIAGRRSSFHVTKETVFGLIKILPLTIFSGFGTIGLLMSWSLGVMIAVFVGVFLLSLLWKGYLPIPTFDPIIKSMISYATGNYFAEIFSSLPRLILPILVFNLISKESTGFFFIAMMIAGILYGIPQAISNSLLAESSDSKELWNNVKKAIKLNAALLFPGILLIILFGKFVLNLFNPLYAENATIALIILSIASLPFSINTMFTAVRNAQKRVSSVIKINAGIAIISLALAFPLLRSSGIEGAAFAFLAANTLAAIVVVYKMKTLSESVLKSILSTAH